MKFANAPYLESSTPVTATELLRNCPLYLMATTVHSCIKDRIMGQRY